VEVENIHDPALVFEPIHRLLTGVTGDLRQALAAALRRPRVSSPSARRRRHARRAGRARRALHAAGLMQPGARPALVVVIDDPPRTLDVATFQAFVDTLLAQGGAHEVDYVHGDDALAQLAALPGHAGLHLATLGKSELLAAWRATARCRARASRWAKPTRSASTSRRGASMPGSRVCRAQA
jgi:hypothetical protein